MSLTINFITGRAIKTISTAKDIESQWTQDPKTITQLQSKLDAIIGNSAATPPVVGQLEVVSDAKRAMDLADGEWQTNLDELHRRTVQGLNMAKNKFRNDPVALGVLKNLNANGDSRKQVLAEALAWESAWEKTAADWNPTTVNTLEAFKTLRQQCAEDLQRDYSDAHATWRKESTKLNSMANELEQDCESWYADATRVFLAGTPEGDLVRSTVPTTYTPKKKTTTATTTPTPGTVPTP